MSQNKTGSKVKKTFYSMGFVNGIRRAVMVSLAILYFISVGYNVIEVTSLFAISTIIMILFEIPTGAFADHFSRKKSIVMSFILLGIAFFGLFIFRNFWLLGISWILGDIAWTFQSGTASAWVVDKLKYGKNKKNLATLFARAFFFVQIGLIIGGLVGFILVSVQFRFVWLAVSLTNLIMAVILSKYIEEDKVKSAKFEFGIISGSFIKAKQAIVFLFNKQNKQARGVTLALFLGTIATASFFVEYPLILSNLGLSPSLVSGLFALVGILVLFAPFLGEKTAHKFGFKNFLGISSIILGIAIILMGLSQSLLFAMIFLVVIRISLDATDAIHESAFQHSIPSNCRATLGSATSVVWGVANSLAVWAIGLVITFVGLGYAAIVSGIFAVLTAITYFMTLKK
ncbi:MAG: MFS transporter [Candidatus Pacearchaeota archaeon]|nr:MFS transporter [Candidatus Pacearchaeota archaeon]